MILNHFLAMDPRDEQSSNVSSVKREHIDIADSMARDISYPSQPESTCSTSCPSPGQRSGILVNSDKICRADSWSACDVGRQCRVGWE